MFRVGREGTIKRERLTFLVGYDKLQLAMPYFIREILWFGGVLYEYI